MPKPSLRVDKLRISREGSVIVDGVSLEVPAGELHALIGPNGSGKSTVANAVMGHPKYHLDGGRVLLDGLDLTTAAPDVRSKGGLFLSSQQPPEIPGVSLTSFLRAAVNAHRDKPLSVMDFQTLLQGKLKETGLPKDFAHRPLNEGFSGGEKKRAELLQLLLLEPKYALLDEIDAGLDADALKIVAKVIENLRRGGTGILLITHATRLLKQLAPNRVHVLVGGRLVASGDRGILARVDNQGYGPFLTKSPQQP